MLHCRHLGKHDHGLFAKINEKKKRKVNKNRIDQRFESQKVSLLQTGVYNFKPELFVKTVNCFRFQFYFRLRCICAREIFFKEGRGKIFYFIICL